MTPYDFPDRDNRKPPEDYKGMRFCLHCINCTMPRVQTIRPFGRWFCFGYRELRKGNDIYEFMCPHFVMRDCATCRRKYYCTSHYIEKVHGLKMTQFTFCKKYENRGIANPNIYYIGRYKMPKEGTKEYDLEVKFRKRYGIEYASNKGKSNKGKIKNKPRKNL